MRDLTALRAELDRLDRELVRLFEQRMLISREVAAVKQAQGMQVCDPVREAQVLDARAAMLENPAYAEDVRTLWTLLMALSRKEQQRTMEEGMNE